MKIGLFSDSYFPDINGVSHHIYHLRKGLEELGHEIFIFCPSYPNYQDREINILRLPILFSTKTLDHIFNVNLDGMIAYPFSKRYSQLISELDIVHSNHTLFVGRYAAYYAGKYNKPLILTNHTNYKEVAATVSVRQVRDLAFRIMQEMVKKYTKRCRLVITPGASMIRQLKEYGVKKVIKVVENAMDLQKYNKPSKNIQKIRKKLGIKRNERIVLYVGRISKEKNLVFLIKSLQPLVAEDKNLKLILVGGGVYKKTIRKLIPENISNKVIFTGKVNYDETPAYYHLADVFVTASMSEVLPLTLIEAQASGLPIVAIKATGTKDIVEDSVTGILCENSPEDLRASVEKLLNDDALREKMGRNAKVNSNKYSAYESAKKHEEIYKEVLGSR